VDAEAEYLIQQALDEVLKGRTALVIAHRLSTIRNADKIMALEGGADPRGGGPRGVPVAGRAVQPTVPAADRAGGSGRGRGGLDSL
jgi:hypothetical protein